MKKAVYNSKKERTKRRRKLEEKTRKEISGRKLQEENFKKKIARRKFQEENFKKKIAKGIGNVWIWIFLM
jgi:polynucleotide 5'-kinase involved in rRNA processing